MTVNYVQAADMFKNLAGEAGALAEYCGTLNLDAGEMDAEIRSNIEERCSDELNHCLGDLLDAIKLSGLEISSDGAVKMLEELKTHIKEEKVWKN